MPATTRSRSAAPNCCAASTPRRCRPSAGRNLAFLLNHVLGEKLNQWPEALRLQHKVIAAAQSAPAPAPAPALVLWRQAAQT